MDTEAGTGSAAADHPERCRTRRSFDLRAMYRTGARQIAASSRTVGDASCSEAPVELEYLGDSAGRGPLHDRRAHHEHRPAEEISRERLRAGDCENQSRCVRGFVPKKLRTQPPRARSITK